MANVIFDTCWIRNLLHLIHHQSTKHIEMNIHFVREKVQRGDVRVLHVPSRYQIVDIFTKGLPQILFDDFRSSLKVQTSRYDYGGVLE